VLFICMTCLNQYISARWSTPSRTHPDPPDIYSGAGYPITLVACSFASQNPWVGLFFSLLLSSPYPSHAFPWPYRNLKYALELVNVVADSRYKLYEDFVNEEGRRLGEYLGAVRQAVLYGLEGGGSDPFRVISSE